ncbi:MAG: twin-arginine translocase subunit TatC [Actinobacteria bacterium]|nr:twin-arginine translocase subunit TatC [Actinomycetota bacterium]MBU4240959.1 twin-arginine translocase subunit TatC [Actinomycetota bacterium]MBU4301218.1 twin-arginine translocase subunit TatC [Actinomycetota bacterium]MBU4489147.1 twin-arginine translocase subunit TatC [Actinomycetota bacterium]
MAFKRGRMTYLQHLEELRRRIIVSIVALVAGCAVSWLFAWDILNILKGPAGNITLHYMKPMEPFLVRFKLTLFGGVLLALPVILFEILAFLSPALKRKERSFTVAVMLMILVFFAAGVTLGYYYIMPVGITWLLDLAGEQMSPVLSASEYVSFAGWFMLAFGIAFETPIFIWMLVALGVLTPEQLRKQWRYAYIVILLFAAIITPDWNPITMMMVAVPMVLLYEISILLARFTVGKRKETANK